MNTDTVVVYNSANAGRRVRSTPIVVAARTALSIAAQVAVLWLINLGASTVVARFDVPVPGNVLGLVLLFALLCSGVVKVAWLEPAATLLVKHFAFFFIPITIGLMGMGGLFAVHGAGILVTLACSAAIGMATCGFTFQSVINAQNVYGARATQESDA